MADKGKYFIFKCFHGARCFIDDKGEKLKKKLHLSLHTARSVYFVLGVATSLRKLVEIATVLFLRLACRRHSQILCHSHIATEKAFQEMDTEHRYAISHFT